MCGELFLLSAYFSISPFSLSNPFPCTWAVGLDGYLGAVGVKELIQNRSYS